MPIDRADIERLASDPVLVRTVVLCCVTSVAAVFYLWSGEISWLAKVGLGIFFGVGGAFVVASNHYLLAFDGAPEDEPGATTAD